MLIRNPRFERWPENRAGRDFVAGDIHGCYRTLEALLRRAQFDSNRDRLFAVGDLVNRGPNSAETTKWLTTGRIARSVLGNHDAAVADTLKRAPYRLRTGWLGTLDHTERGRLADALAELPLGSELETVHGPVGIVHAGVIDRDWHETRRRIEAGDEAAIAHVLFGGRSGGWQGRRATPVTGVSLLVTGHEPREEAWSDGYWYEIDTGAGFPHLNRLTLLEVTARPPRCFTHSVVD